MTKRKYGIIKAKKLPEFPPRNLLRVPHGKGILTVAYPAFGPNYFKNNVREMQKDYSHPRTGKRISFREPTTSKSISAYAYKFKNLAKPKTLHINSHMGYIVRTSEGVFANPPKDEQGNPIIDEQTLKYILDGGFVDNVFFNQAEKVNGIYLGENDFGFAPYETFTRGKQDCDTFAQGGLARVLEHTSKKQAKNLKVISSKNYPGRVDVSCFREAKKPVLNVVGLSSFRDLEGNILFFYCSHWDDNGDGHAFGVLK